MAAMALLSLNVDARSLRSPTPACLTLVLPTPTGPMAICHPESATRRLGDSVSDSRFP